MTENHIFNISDTAMSEKQMEAVKLHKKILANGQIAAEAIVELAKNLKEMRDSKLYIEMGHECFDDYCEKSAHIRQRQAYKFIKALEEFGEQKLFENSGLGITKLAALATLCVEDRENIMSSENVQEMSTRELEEKIAELKKKCEQLTLELGDEVSDKESIDKQNERLQEEKAKLELRLKQLEEENKALRDKPLKTAPSEASENDILKIKKEITLELEEAKAKEIAKIKAENDAANAKSKKAQEQSEEKITQLEKQLEDLKANANKNKTLPPPNGNKELIKYHFNAIQTAFNSAAEIISGLQNEEKTQFKKATLKLLDNCKTAVEEV